MRHNESRLQMMCVRWFRLQYPELAPLLFAVPNGGKRNAREAERFKAEGVTAGVADLLLLKPYCGGLTSPPTPPKGSSTHLLGNAPTVRTATKGRRPSRGGVGGWDEAPHDKEHYYALCIEMKWGKGRQSEHQRAWQEAVTAQGYRYEVVRSFEDFQALIEEYVGRRADPCRVGSLANASQVSHT